MQYKIFISSRVSPVGLSLNLSEVVRSADCQVSLNTHTDDHVNARNNTDSVKTLGLRFNFNHLTSGHL